MSVLRERLRARSRRRRSRSAERLFRKTPVFRNNGWLPGGWAFYYVRRLDPRLNPGEERYHRRVWLHRLGTAPHTDALVFGEGRGRTQFYSVTVTADGWWLAVRASSGTGRRSDVYLADLTAGPPERPLLRPVQEGLPAASRVHVVPGTGPQDALWLRTDHGAPRGRVVAVRPADLHLGPRAWREVIPERPDATLTHLTVLPGPAPCTGPGGGRGPAPDPGTPGPGTGSGLGLGSAPTPTRCAPLVRVRLSGWGVLWRWWLGAVVRWRRCWCTTWPTVRIWLLLRCPVRVRSVISRPGRTGVTRPASRTRIS
ncbi:MULTISPECIES: hypothetical protein [Streptomyces]|uniref:hypothetical protein n=1 Tax=Streptomyces TaxID=1883 RepID=UPI001EFCEB7F|nr:MULTISPECIES: hypothetical protein [Streptomyces]MDI7790216.1 hypothetical protein [Streptomyces cavourensis]